MNGLLSPQHPPSCWGIGRRQLEAVLAFLVAVGAVFSLAGCDISPSRYRARITVEVDTPQGVRSGSSVVEILAGKTLGLLPDERKAQVELHGEAVAVDLPGGQTLFALLRTANDDQSPERAITAALDPSFQGGAEGFLETVPKLGRPEMVGRSASLPPESYPMLVRFRNILHPATVERVDPDNLETNFGPGVRLKHIQVEITDAPVITGISARFPWWLNYLNKHFDGSSTVSEDMTTNNLAAHLSSGSFSTEFRK